MKIFFPGFRIHSEFFLINHNGSVDLHTPIQPPPYTSKVNLVLNLFPAQKSDYNSSKNTLNTAYFDIWFNCQLGSVFIENLTPRLF